MDVGDFAADVLGDLTEDLLIIGLVGLAVDAKMVLFLPFGDGTPALSLVRLESASVLFLLDLSSNVLGFAEIVEAA